MTNYDILKEYEAHKTPVPSYEEWKELVQDYSEKHDSYLRLSQTNHQLHKFLEEFNALDVAKENQQLKELLKECRDFIDFCTAKCFGIDKEKMTTKIDNAIGEK